MPLVPPDELVVRKERLVPSRRLSISDYGTRPSGVLLMTSNIVYRRISRRGLQTHGL